MVLVQEIELEEVRLSRFGRLKIRLLLRPTIEIPIT